MKPLPSTVWKPGQSGNPNGRPKLPEATQRLKELAKIEAIEAISKVMSMTQRQIDQTAADQDELPAALVLAASVMKKAIKYGCAVRTQLMYSYVIGKPETYSADTPDQNPEDNTIRLAYSKADL